MNRIAAVLRRLGQVFAGVRAALWRTLGVFRGFLHALRAAWAAFGRPLLFRVIRKSAEGLLGKIRGLWLRMLAAFT